jgi:hypothetical protein
MARAAGGAGGGERMQSAAEPVEPAACYGMDCPKGEKGLGMTDFRYRAAARNVEAARDHGQTCAASRHCAHAAG